MRGPRSVLALGVALAALAVGCGPSSSSAPTGGAGASELVGSWTSTVTRADLAAKGISDVHGQDENSGTFTWTFAADGTWSSVQTSVDGAPIANPVFRGTWTGGPGTLVVTTIFPPEYADKGLHFTWKIEDGKLSLRVLDPPDPVMPLIVETHPWVRASG